VDVCGAACVVSGTAGEGFAATGAVCPNANPAAREAAPKVVIINRIICILFLKKKNVR